MQHRELYRTLVPEDAYIITYSDLAACKTQKAAERIAKSIYYRIGGSYSSESMKCGVEAHHVKELEESYDFNNEVRLVYKMSDSYYLAGTIDRYYNKGFIVDYKTTTKPASSYMDSKQIETYAFLAMNNDLVVNSGMYTTIDKDGKDLDSDGMDIYANTVVTCYSTFILPRFNLIKNEIERLRNQYVERND